ncbi:MAG: hypothetical protein ACXIU8_15540 [Alkalilacustris sp.]
MISPTLPPAPAQGAPVALREAHRSQMIGDKLVANLTLLVLFLAFLAWSIHISRFTPDRLAAGLPRIFEYVRSVMPSFQWDMFL